MKSVFKTLILCMLCQGTYSLAFCQSSETELQSKKKERKYSSNFTGLKVGVGYPFYAIKKKDYTFLSNAGNYAFAGYLELGHKFKSGVSISLSPALVYSKFAKQVFEYDKYEDQLFIKYLHGEKSHAHLSFFLPLFIEVDVGKRFRVAGGGFMYKLLASNVYESTSGKVYYQYINNKYYPHGFPNSISSWGALNKYDVPRYAYGGWQLRVSYVVKSLRNKKEWALSLEYYNSLEIDYRYEAYERWINLVYSRRILH